MRRSYLLELRRGGEGSRSHLVEGEDNELPGWGVKGREWEGGGGATTCSKKMNMNCQTEDGRGGRKGGRWSKSKMVSCRN